MNSDLQIAILNQLNNLLETFHAKGRVGFARFSSALITRFG